MKFTKWSDLSAFVDAAVNATLNIDVSSIVVKALMMSAEDEIYSVYQPMPKRGICYERRDSFVKEDGYLIEDARNGKLMVKPHVEFNQTPVSNNTGYGLAELIEYGNGKNGNYYEYSSGWYKRGQEPYKKPRPFVETAAEELERNRAHAITLAAGLADYGIEARIK